ncbi:zinc ribbon domain-containing protein [Paraburkholderia tagetis]|uniref:Zinc ribbon domain-containing protein n=1 Tax=Paraburkholderia tagetis TaxID=2913261 RepID=A0A9X1UMK9_9BURK|nr:zinc ribbon domain-containing protein [Paraburkholderia tagetis]MCG5077872.1 zinc ribbon domain-containing protein [Paraburkholderia tagetis]
MSETVLVIPRCNACGEALFPARYRCPRPRCGAADWTSEPAAGGAVEETTVVRHRVGAQGAGDVYLSSVRTQAGPVVIARSDTALREGERVALTIDEAMRVWARAR